MVSKKLLYNFSLQYNLNVEISKEWSDKIFHISDKSTLLHNLKTRSNILQEIYKKNENLLKQCMDPIKHYTSFEDHEYETIFFLVKRSLLKK